MLNVLIKVAKMHVNHKIELADLLVMILYVPKLVNKLVSHVLLNVKIKNVYTLAMEMQEDVQKCADMH